MPDIFINRCTLRIVRHGGWSWGPDPRRLLKSVLEALPALLARELLMVWPDDADREIAAPIRIRVPVRIGELIAAAGDGPGEDVLQPATKQIDGVSARIADALRTALRREQMASVTGVDSEAQGREEQQEDEPGIAQVPTPDSAVLQLLTNWRMSGLLETNLAAFSLTALEAWHGRLIAGDFESLDRAAFSQEDIDSLVSALAAAKASLYKPADTLDGVVGEIANDHRARDDRAGRLRRRILVLTKAAVRLKLQPGDPTLLAALDRALPLGDQAEPRLSEEGYTVETQQTRRGALSGEGKLAAGQDSSPSAALLPLLLDWQETGMLEEHLASFSLADLEAWHRRLIVSEPGSSVLQTQASEKIDELLAEIAPQSPARSVDREAVLRVRIAVLVEAAARLRIQSRDPMLLAALDRAAPLPWSDAGRDTLIAERGSIHRPHIPAPSPRPASSLRRTRFEQSCHVRSALPFLLLGPLSRSGYLKTLAATFEAADCQADSQLFAAALAYKVLDPPARGWRREQSMINAASAFAALAEHPAESDLVDFARRVSPHLSPLEAALSGALIANHDPRQPLLLHRAESEPGDGLLLLDVEGVIPISWAPDAAGLRRSLIRLESSAILISQATAQPELLKWIDREGLRFITDAAPTRGERWRALRRPPRERWWTNDGLTQESELVRMARALESAPEDAGTLWQALAVQRPSIPLAEEPELDRHITLAASAALGTIAWALWRERESTAPHLALERFRDLDARIAYSRDAVRVSLPLGRRFQDLRDHGLASDVVDVPWLAGRGVTFTAG